ncbi:MAG: DUF1905 domain-containing protein [Alphaproteobacteria bacterium]|nr:DUF1905 domain-containing protein [Alphaproteobacteria bacterium]MCB9695997.1 DUF1905 domain-containing protein [Alphaproteobacteria bacterium]
MAQIERGEQRNTAGFVVPASEVEALGKGKRPPVVITVNGHSWRSTVATMGGAFMVGFPAEHRAAAGVGDDVESIEIALALDDQPRMTPVPEDLAAALTAAGALAAFEALAPSRRKEHVRKVEEAKAPATRERRIAAVVASLAST